MAVFLALAQILYAQDIHAILPKKAAAAVLYNSGNNYSCQLAIIYLDADQDKSGAILDKLPKYLENTLYIKMEKPEPKWADELTGIFNMENLVGSKDGFYSSLADMAVDTVLLMEKSGPENSCLIASGRGRQAPSYDLELVHETSNKLGIKMADVPIEDFYRYMGAIKSPEALSQSLEAGMPAIYVSVPDIEEFAACYFSLLYGKKETGIRQQTAESYFRYPLSGKILLFKDRQIVQMVLGLVLFLLLFASLNMPGTEERRKTIASAFLESIWVFTLAFLAVITSFAMIASAGKISMKLFGSADAFANSPNMAIALLILHFLCLLSAFYALSSFFSQKGVCAINKRTDAIRAAVALFAIMAILCVVFCPPLAVFSVAATLATLFAYKNNITSILGLAAFLLVFLPYMNPEVLLGLFAGLKTEGSLFTFFVVFAISASPFLLWLEAAGSKGKALYRSDKSIFLWLGLSVLSAVSIALLPLVKGL
ncbi:hypothetical protein MASR2M29_21920 [Spirochaetota bacterium]